MRALTDEQLATLAQGGDYRAANELARRYEATCRALAGEFFYPGADADDLRQEARVGLLNAIRRFSVERGVPFKGYARFSITRQLITGLKLAQRHKHQVLSESIRHVRNDDGELVEALDFVPDASVDFDRTLEQRAILREIGRGLRVKLSASEAACLILYANGASYEAIQALTNLPSVKVVDNALQRAKKKLAGIEATPERREYICPSCGHETVRVTARGHERRGAGRPPACNVCQTRRLAA